ncbi:MAG: PQQ-dependent sugar dehydrogenase [Acidimicrobiia bacterium]
MRLLLFILMAALACAACSADESIPVVEPPPASTTSTSVPDQPARRLIGLEIVEVVTGLSEPVAVAPAVGIGRTFVVERTGRLIAADQPPTAVLDITGSVGWDVNEQGFLGFAVHPRFPEDSRGFAVYTNKDRDVVVSSFDWTGDVFDASSEQTVLLVTQPHKYHQGGGILFGPRGMLWLSLGDGGGGGDKRKNGQDPTTLRGTLVRIDVDRGSPYAIPSTNPYATSDENRPEIWAIGLRNPWRFTIDGVQLVVADVGEHTADEINVTDVDAPGLNYGWPIMEGFDCFQTDPCDTEGLTTPEFVIPRTRSCALIGGPVYRGSQIPELFGHYLYGDFCIGWIRSAPLLNGTLGPEVNWEPFIGQVGMITSIAADHKGELLITTIEGRVLALEPTRDG